MAVLCDTQIRELVGIEPFQENIKRPGRVSFGLSSYGYDVRVGTRFKVFTNTTSGGAAVVDPKNFSDDLFITIDTAETGRDHIIIPPNSFALAETMEEIKVPRDVLAICVGKSTYARCGIIVNVTPLEPEWRGKVTMEISNTTPLPAKIYANEGIAQVIFIKADRVCAVSYADKGGKYQDQKGLTLPIVDHVQLGDRCIHRRGAEQTAVLVKITGIRGGGSGGKFFVDTDPALDEVSGVWENFLTVIDDCNPESVAATFLLRLLKDYGPVLHELAGKTFELKGEPFVSVAFPSEDNPRWEVFVDDKPICEHDGLMGILGFRRLIDQLRKFADEARADQLVELKRPVAVVRTQRVNGRRSSETRNRGRKDSLPKLPENHLMSKTNRNSGKAWKPQEVKELRSLARENTPTRVIGLKLGRTEGAVYSKASERHISLKPTNQSPYNRRKK